MSVGSFAVHNRDQRGFTRPGAGVARCSIGAVEANASPGPLCGDSNLNDSVTASDALAVLKAAVGGDECQQLPCVCDVNGSGTITASDALADLKRAVGQLLVLTCQCN